MLTVLSREVTHADAAERCGGRHVVTPIFLAIFVLSSPPMGSVVEPTTLEGAAVRALSSLPSDPPSTNNGTHYVVSNERRLDLFAERAGDHRAGAYIGVGAEQNYVLMGWSRPEVAVLLDFDPVVGDVHRLHLAFLAGAEDAEGYLAYWSRRAEEVDDVLARTIADTALRARAASAFREFAPAILARLRALSVPKRERPRTYLDDPEQFARLQALVRAGRVFVAQGDLTGQRTVTAVAKTLRDAGLVVRTLYLSNAEQYFMYGPDYRQNMTALPMDKGSVVLRTLPGRPRDFEYITQRGTRFQEWVASSRVRSVYAIRGLTRGEHLVGETAVELRGRPPPTSEVHGHL